MGKFEKAIVLDLGTRIFKKSKSVSIFLNMYFVVTSEDPAKHVKQDILMLLGRRRLSVSSSSPSPSSSPFLSLSLSSSYSWKNHEYRNING